MVKKKVSFLKMLSLASTGTAIGLLKISNLLKRKSEECHFSKTGSENNEIPGWNKKPVLDEIKLKHKIRGSYESFSDKLKKDSLIILIFGKRGSGKSALGFKLLENLNAITGRKCYALGIRQGLLPYWIKSINDIDEVEDGGALLVDEGAISFSSRESMTEKNKELSRIMAIARHRELTLIFITQNTGMIDRNILKLVDTLFIKEGSLLQSEMERHEIKNFYIKAKEAFDRLKGDKKTLAYVVDSDFEGVVSYRLPSFWKEKLSKNKGHNPL